MKIFKNKYNNKIEIILAFLCAILFILSSAIGSFQKVKAKEVPQAVNGNYYTADYQSKEEAMAAADNLNEEICEEGFTMLKNEDNALPLAENAKISIFGKSSSEMLYGLSSNYVYLRGQMTTLQDSLKDAGFGLNQNLINFYNSKDASGAGRGAQPTNGSRTVGYNTGETPVNMYTPELEESYSEYSDAAIVVFSRSCGEGWDMPRSMRWNGSNYTSGTGNQLVPGARSVDDHYLQLDKNESDLLKYVGEKFNKVVVLLNVPSQFETGFLDDPGNYGYHKNIKAAFWLGYPGRTGLKAIGKILKGEVNPSGKTVDTWARDFKKDPTWNNFYDFSETNLNRYNNNVGNFVVYKEGIYVGYRYYETRGVTEGLNQPYVADGTTNEKINGTTTTQWNDWYQSQVVYPFGHGLSYTTFKQEITQTSIPENTSIGENDVITVSVKVTNQGTVAGKSSVLLFYTAPYDTQSTSAIEKAQVVLGGFNKTKLLQPQESQTVSISIKARDMASYDYSDANKNNFKGYELESGKYDIKLMKDAHTLISKVSYNVPQDIKILTDDATNNPITNQFDDVSNYLTDSTADGGLGEVYLSRRDFAGTFPQKTPNLNLSSARKTKMSEWTGSNIPSDQDKPYYVAEEDTPTFGNDSGTYKLSDLIGLDYNDPLWETYLNEISKSTMKKIVCEGSYRSGIDNADLGITRVINAGQPAGYMSLFSGMEGAQYAFFSSDVITASTYNTELAYKKGIAIGNEALFGTGKGKSRFPGWYAPAADTHRSAFGGRNADYYSEDGMLAGKMAAGIIKGAMEKGVFCFLKHFALNEQENSRIQMITWANEQAMREIYFKSFELGVKEGKTAAIMSALNRLGTTWTGGNYELLTNVLRKEWGFCGMVVTDSYINGFSNMAQMLRAGGDLALGNASSGEYDKLEGATALTVMRNSVHNILWVMANSMAMNIGYATPPELLNEYNSTEVPVGSVNLAYSFSIASATINKDAFSDGTIPSDSEIQYNLKEGSTLPQGLTLSTSGLISGTPTEEATAHKFTVVASYSTAKKEATYYINISDANGSILYQADKVIKDGLLGETYQDTISTAEIYKRGATPEEIAAFPTITYTMQNGSFLPDGLTLSIDGTISGTPIKECKDYSFTVVASALGFKDVEGKFTISINAEVTYTGKNLSLGKIGESYLEKVNTANCDKTLRYSLKEGSTLPRGLQLTSTGIITGTPLQTVDNHSFTVIANGEYCQEKEAEFTISIGLSYNRMEMPNGEKGEEYYSSVNNAQGADVITYRLKEGSVLPEGLTLSEDGIITGTPTKAGVYKITVEACSDDLMSDEREITIYIAGDNANVGLIVGLIIAGVVVIGGTTVAVVLICSKKKKNKK